MKDDIITISHLHHHRSNELESSVLENQWRIILKTIWHEFCMNIKWLYDQTKNLLQLDCNHPAGDALVLSYDPCISADIDRTVNIFLDQSLEDICVWLFFYFIPNIYMYQNINCGFSKYVDWLQHLWMQEREINLQPCILNVCVCACLTFELVFFDNRAWRETSPI